MVLVRRLGLDGASEAGGAKFWFHGLRNHFITVAERELILPRSLTKRLVNHARPGDVTKGYAADWTVEQLREPAQRIANRIDDLMRPEAHSTTKCPASSRLGHAERTMYDTGHGPLTTSDRNRNPVPPPLSIRSTA